MGRTRVVVAASVGAVVGFVLSIQLQWALIDGLGSDEACDDVVTGMALCAGPQPLLIASLAGGLVGAVAAVMLLRRFWSRSS